MMMSMVNCGDIINYKYFPWFLFFRMAKPGHTSAGVGAVSGGSGRLAQFSPGRASVHSLLFLSHSITMEWLDQLLSSLDNSEESTLSTLSTPSPSPPPSTTSAWLGLPPFTAIQVASPLPLISTSPPPPISTSPPPPIAPSLLGGAPSPSPPPHFVTPTHSSSPSPPSQCPVIPTHSASSLPGFSTITFASSPCLLSSAVHSTPSPPQPPARKGLVILTLRRPPAVGGQRECSCCVHQVLSCRIRESEIKIRRNMLSCRRPFFNLLLPGWDFL